MVECLLSSSKRVKNSCNCFFLKSSINVEIHSLNDTLLHIQKFQSFLFLIRRSDSLIYNTSISVLAITMDYYAYVSRIQIRTDLLLRIRIISWQNDNITYSGCISKTHFYYPCVPVFIRNPRKSISNKFAFQVIS